MAAPPHLAQRRVARGRDPPGHLPARPQWDQGRLWRAGECGGRPLIPPASGRLRPPPAAHRPPPAHHPPAQVDELEARIAANGQQGRTVGHCCVSSSHCGGTYVGIERGGTRLAEEVRALAATMPHLRSLSLVGHSLGGVYCRYALKLLGSAEFGLDPSISFDTYVSIASPHLGCRCAARPRRRWWRDDARRGRLCRRRRRCHRRCCCLPLAHLTHRLPTCARQPDRTPRPGGRRRGRIRSTSYFRLRRPASHSFRAPTSSGWSSLAPRPPSRCSMSWPLTRPTWSH